MAALLYFTILLEKHQQIVMIREILQRELCVQKVVEVQVQFKNTAGDNSYSVKQG